MESPSFLDKNAVSFGNYSVSFAQNSRSNFSKVALFSEKVPLFYPKLMEFLAFSTPTIPTKPTIPTVPTPTPNTGGGNSRSVTGILKCRK